MELLVYQKMKYIQTLYSMVDTKARYYYGLDHEMP